MMSSFSMRGSVAPQKMEPNCILLLTVNNAVYPITVEVIHKIASRFGNVLRIVIFKKNGVQAMVEFDSIDAAHEAKKALHNCDIYAGCCTLSVEYSKATRLNVQRNNIETGWDFTVEPSFDRPEPKRTTLLDAPPQRSQDFGGRKRPYEGEDDMGGHMEPRRPEPYLQPPGRSSFTEPPVREPAYRESTYEDRPHRGPPRDDFMPPRGELRPPRGDMPLRGDYGPPRGDHPSSRSVLGNVLSQFPGRLPPRGDGGRRPRDDYEDRPYREERFEERGGRHGGDDFGRYEDEGHRRGGYGDQGMGGGIVLMVYGLDDRMTCDRLFNILCVYGNVMKIRFLKTVEGGAMVQMSDNMAVERCISYLGNEVLFGKKLQLRVSKQTVVQDVQNPYELADGSPSFMIYATSRNNRFNSPEQSSKNRLSGVTEHLHFFNSPPDVTEERIREIFADAGAPEPVSVVMFPSRSERSSTGLITMANGEDGLAALALVNHIPVESSVFGHREPVPVTGVSKRPFIFKLCFASGKGTPGSKREPKRGRRSDGDH